MKSINCTPSLPILCISVQSYSTLLSAIQWPMQWTFSTWWKILLWFLLLISYKVAEREYRSPKKQAPYVILLVFFFALLPPWLPYISALASVISSPSSCNSLNQNALLIFRLPSAMTCDRLSGQLLLEPSTEIGISTSWSLFMDGWEEVQCPDGDEMLLNRDVARTHGLKAGNDNDASLISERILSRERERELWERVLKKSVEMESQKRASRGSICRGSFEREHWMERWKI